MPELSMNQRALGGNRPLFWSVLQRCCQIAATVDICFLVIFLWLGSPILAWVNVISVLMYSGAYVALDRRRIGLATLLIWGEVLGHAALGTVMIGWGSGFHYFLLMFIPMIFTSLKPRQAAAITMGLWLYYIALDITMWSLPPIQPISTNALHGIHLFNLTVVFAMFSYLSFFYMQVIRRAYRKQQRLAVTDPLTQIYNRRQMAIMAEQEFARASRHGQALSLLLLDLDHFKQINDTHGHDVGDHVLVSVTQIIKSELRTQDVLARWGGEEFLAMLPETNLEQAANVAERIRQAIRQRTWSEEHAKLAVSASIGVSQRRPDDDLSALISRADSALYTAKRAGRDRIEAFQVDPLIN